MKNKRIIRILTMFVAVMLCMTAFSVTAFAGGGEEAETTAAPETETESETTEPVSLTPDGNLTLVDDLSGEESEDKQFITVVTKSGNYFYLIIDRASDSENVYFLNMVDEADLMALIEDADGAATSTITTPAVTTPEPEATEPDTSEVEPEQSTGGSMGGTLLIVLIIAALGGGAFYYFKILKPKQSVKGSTDFDEFDFDDEDEETEYISEEEAADTGDGEQEDNQ